MDENIHALIASGEITALTLDTSIFERAGLAMEAGLLAQIEQFRGSEIRLVVASVVANEVRRHLAENAEKSVSSLQNALRETGRQQALPVAVQQLLTTAVEEVSTATRNRAQQRFDDWATRAGVTILNEAEFASIADVMHCYEAGEPPFNVSGQKKHEFPDAVALSTLEGWAGKEHTKILTVTQDNDWKRYGVQSKSLIMVDDLADALAGFQHLAAATKVAHSLAASLGKGDPLGLGKALLSAVKQDDENIEFNVDADSQFSVEVDWVEADFQKIELGDPEDAKSSFETVSFSDGEAVVKITAIATAVIDVQFSFDKWDGIDREFMPMGSTTISSTELVEFEALVTVVVGVDDEMTIESIEILPMTHQMYFSEIEPDWMSDPDSFES